jgi:putative restriction endonuclease
MSQSITPSPRSWTRDELLVVLNLYQKLAFGQFHSRNPAVISLAATLGRTPSSVAMKLSNFASLDPTLQQKGLEGASKLDREVWGAFQSELAENVVASEEALRTLFNAGADEEIEVSGQQGILKRRELRTPEVTETVASRVQRRGQAFFRDLVLNNYGEKCAVSAIDLRDLLVASHIVPWSSNPSERLNVANGICLSRLHDAAFDRGLITFDDDLRLRLSSRLTTAISTQTMLAKNFSDFEGRPLHIPDDSTSPSRILLAIHRETIFQG